MRNRRKVHTPRASLQFSHRALKFGVDPLPNALSMEEVLAFCTRDCLPILELVTADGALVRLLSLLLGFLVDLVLDGAEHGGHLRLDQTLGARFLPQLHDPGLKLLHVALPGRHTDAEADGEQDDGQADAVQRIPPRKLILLSVLKIQHAHIELGMWRIVNLPNGQSEREARRWYLDANIVITCLLLLT